MNKNRIIKYTNAINEALQGEMVRDGSVFVFGPDVSDHKKSYGITANLVEKFGVERCFSTPLSEDGLMGLGLGAAINGLRPIYMHIRVDFMLLALNQLFNMVATYSYGSAGKLTVPLVIRAVIGRGWGQGFQHSKSLQSIFAHIPGLKVVMPTSPYDAKGLMVSAIRDDNPVIFLEHRWLHDVEGHVPKNQYNIPFGRAKIVRNGKDITIIATSWMNIEAVEAAKFMAKRNVEVEIVDPRTISPLDERALVGSVRKTGHCIVADYDWVNCGFGAEVAARISEKCFGVLKSPVIRIGFAPTPCPTTRNLENKFYPNSKSIIREIEKKLKLKPADLSNEKLYSHEDRFRGPF